MILGFTSGQDHVAIDTEGHTISFNPLSGSFADYASAAAAAASAIHNAGGTAATVVTAQVGSDTYLFVDSDANHLLTTADEVIKFTGVSGLHNDDLVVGQFAVKG